MAAVRLFWIKSNNETPYSLLHLFLDGLPVATKEYNLGMKCDMSSSKIVTVKWKNWVLQTSVGRQGSPPCLWPSCANHSKFVFVGVILWRRHSRAEGLLSSATILTVHAIISAVNSQNNNNNNRNNNNNNNNNNNANTNSIMVMVMNANNNAVGRWCSRISVVLERQTSTINPDKEPFSQQSAQLV